MVRREENQGEEQQQQLAGDEQQEQAEEAEQQPQAAALHGIEGFIGMLVAPAAPMPILPELPEIQPPLPAHEEQLRHSTRLKSKPTTKLTPAVLMQKIDFLESGAKSKEEQSQQLLDLFSKPLPLNVVAAVGELLEVNAGP